MFAAPLWLTEGATVAGAVTVILSAVAVLGRVLRKVSIIDRFHHWIVEGWRQDRREAFVVILKEELPEVLDTSLSFNGTGRFRDDMRAFYSNVSAFMSESRADRADLHRRLDGIDQGEQH